MILDGPNNLLQTIYHEECSTLVAVAIDESTGKIAIASLTEVYIYRPFGKQDGLLRVIYASFPMCARSLILFAVVAPMHTTSRRARARRCSFVVGYG